jgi:hypothetical protein
MENGGTEGPPRGDGPSLFKNRTLHAKSQAFLKTPYPDTLVSV